MQGYLPNRSPTMSHPPLIIRSTRAHFAFTHSHIFTHIHSRYHVPSLYKHALPTTRALLPRHTSSSSPPVLVAARSSVVRVGRPASASSPRPSLQSSTTSSNRSTCGCGQRRQYVSEYACTMRDYSESLSNVDSCDYIACRNLYQTRNNADRRKTSHHSRAHLSASSLPTVCIMGGIHVLFNVQRRAVLSTPPGAHSESTANMAGL